MVVQGAVSSPDLDVVSNFSNSVLAPVATFFVFAMEACSRRPKLRRLYRSTSRLCISYCAEAGRNAGQARHPGVASGPDVLPNAGDRRERPPIRWVWSAVGGTQPSEGRPQGGVRQSGMAFAGQQCEECSTQGKSWERAQGWPPATVPGPRVRSGLTHSHLNSECLC